LETIVQSRLPRFLSAVFALLVALTCASTAHAHGVTLRVHHAAPADSPFHTRFLVPWTQKVENESSGHIRFQLFPASQLAAGAGDLYEQVKNGGADIVWTAARPAAESRAGYEIFELPFMANSAEGSSRALWEFLRVNDLAQKDFAGVRLLAVHQHDAPQFHLANKAVKSLGDLSGLKIYSPTRVTGRFLAALGASPVDLPLARVSEALAKGTLDGALMPWESASAFKVSDAAKFHSEIDPKSAWPYSSISILAMNPQTYKSLSDDLKKVIAANSGAETSAALGRVFDAGAAAARKLAAERGDAINALPTAELAKWQAPAQTLIADWIKELDQGGLNGKELMESARALLAEHDSRK
jgi:TRAP-type transport system periplasmic protein